MCLSELGRIPHTHFLASAHVLASSGIESCRAVSAEDGAPKADLFRLAPGFATRVLARLPAAARREMLRLCGTAALTLMWAVQVPAPVAPLLAQGQWPCFIHPIPAQRVSSRALFGGICHDPAADIV